MTHFSHDYEQGIKDEQERIIKLLQTEQLVCTPENPNPQYDYLIWCGIREQLIQIIKEEQK